ncbi:methyl-accepting chemotaxis protein [Methylocystis echinoides]|uniref:Methyl-accepting chemotaxis protein n=1 Tax=Methylocystis echinoides TaxID=29468 RepID=A0A9W6GXW5_9HYPH|nr:methyl-accepting chemotaxis protein [Methylocystis echinoides]GLI95012.1 methyl-accepting chemotaxis protein [Methylocystis echinoides]
MRVDLDNMKLGVKTLIPIGVLTLLFMTVLLLGTHRLYTLKGNYATLVERSNEGLLKLAKASRLASEIGYSTHILLDYQVNDPQAKAAQDSFHKSPALAQSLLREIAVVWPEHAKSFEDFAERIGAIADEAARPVAMALGMPGVDAGTNLKPVELDQMSKAARLLNAVDAKIEKLNADMAALDREQLAELREQAVDLRSGADAAIWLMLGAALVSTVVGVASSIWLTRTAIVIPILGISAQMKQVANDNLGVIVSGVTRDDEMGDMARALERLKQNSLSHREGEANAAQERSRVEAEHRASEQRLLQNERDAVAQSLGRALKALSQKDLTHRMTDDLPDAYRRLQEDFNAAMTQLEAAISHVANGANQINGASMEITSAADDLSRRTEQQAASIEETVAAISEITSTVGKTASGAQHASGVVSSTKTDAEKSGTVVKQAVEAITRIDRSSQNIAQIISVIDEIAFQTNLLALNAGVEAARAGEAGKGFAVVASEVRALAQRSAEAAKEIKGLISSSTQEVSEGVTLVVEAGKALERIVAAVSEIDRIVSEIAIGASEQATSLQQINTAVEQMDQDVQKNAAMVEETTAATHNLKRETEALISSIASFRLERKEAAPRAQAPLKLAAAAGSAPRARNAPVDDDWVEF